jgi:DNA polymerase-3 subunit delta'
VPFRDILGHRHLLRLLARSVATQSVPQSLIFAGPDGVGKRRVALALAQAFNCVHAGAGSQEPGASGRGAGAADELASDACGQCSPCKRIARVSYPDVLIVEPQESGSIKIEQIRDVVSQSAYRPFEGRRRVVVVDAADAMGTDAQDALLKSLEEPPPTTVFVLVTARPDALLPTVRSRCSRLRFGRLRPAEIARALVRDHGYTEEEACTMAALSGGSLGRALEASADEFDDVRKAACQALRAVAGAADARGRLDSVQVLVGGGAAAAALERETLAARLTVLLSLFRDLAILSTRAHGDALANLDLTSELQALSGFYERDRAVRAFAAADRALSALRGNASPKIVADWLVLQL